MDTQNQSLNTAASMPHFQIPDYVLDDLCSRFVINIPEEERLDLIRIFFQIEQAHWFYLDFYCADSPELKTCGIKDFSGQIFKHCPSLSGHAQEVEKIMGDFKSYKMTVPTYGAIMLDPDMKYCLLVQGFYTKASWGFPKGKINAEESPEDCAVREVLEETGFDVKELLKPENYLESQRSDQLTRLYIINGVPLTTKFQPRTRKEIKSLQWFPIDALPAHKKDLTSKMQLNMNPNCFFMVIPFVKPLRKWIYNKNNPQEAQRPKSANSSTYKAKIQEGQEQMGLRSRIKQQQYFTLQNQTEFKEFLQYKEQVLRGHDEHTRSISPKKEGYQKGQSDPNLGYSPNPQQEKKKYQILNRNGTLAGKPRRSLATQFDNGAFPGGQDQSMSRSSDGGGFCPDAWKNFKFDMEPILACLPLDRRSLV
ncbi:hypothetical protein ACJMK2_043114 [Sinanodonta woodiana]|uniref:m7GpppN-mRNA hydrolase n=1 Tax=Sinanodonta woodiana TaxID=1069815 RepID=A0ABD3VVX3_SINWO